jgi:hypothetical protein
MRMALYGTEKQLVKTLLWRVVNAEEKKENNKSAKELFREVVIGTLRSMNAGDISEIMKSFVYLEMYVDDELTEFLTKKLEDELIDRLVSIYFEKEDDEE